jgi:16S rRNA (uracil1498-N3)-methyltransferase
VTELYYVSPDRISNDEVTFTAEESVHILKSRRRGAGDEIRVTDGRGRVMRIRITREGKEVEGCVVESRQLPVTPLVLDLAVGMSKKERMSWLVEKGTEIGMTNLFPLITSWSRIRRHRDDWRGHLDRWDRVSISALKQSERYHLPGIEAPKSLDRFLGEGLLGEYDLKILLDFGEDAVRLESLFESWMRRFLVVVGPEGGFSRDEVSRMSETGFLKARLIERPLRFETAAISALALIATRFTDRVD